MSIRGLIIIVFSILFNFSCGEEEEKLEIIQFPRCDIYPIFLHDVSESIWGLTWSPDGNTVVFNWRNDLWMTSPYGGKPKQITDMEGAEIYPAYYPDPATNKLVFVHSDEGMGQGNAIYTLYNIAPGKGEPELIKELGDSRLKPSWSFDGKKIILYGFDSKAIYAMDSEGGEISEILNNDGWGFIKSAQASPARNVVVYIESDFEVPLRPHLSGLIPQDNSEWSFRLKSISIDGGEPFLIHNFSNWMDYMDISESYDGSMIACTTAFPGVNRNLLLIPSGFGEPILITDFEDYYAYPMQPAWCPDGKKLVVQLGKPMGIHRVDLKL